MSLLLQLIELLQQQLANLLGQNEDVSGSTHTVSTGESESTAATGDIVASGNLVMTTDANYATSVVIVCRITDYWRTLCNRRISAGYRSKGTAESDDERRTDLRRYSLELWYCTQSVMFEPFAAEWYQDDQNSGWQEDPFVTLRGFDDSNAHVQPSGCIIIMVSRSSLWKQRRRWWFTLSPIVGFAGDGFPVYGHHLYEEDATDPESDIITFTSGYATRMAHAQVVLEDHMMGHIMKITSMLAVNSTNVTADWSYTRIRRWYILLCTTEISHIPRCLMGTRRLIYDCTGGQVGEVVLASKFLKTTILPVESSFFTCKHKVSGNIPAPLQTLSVGGKNNALSHVRVQTGAMFSRRSFAHAPPFKRCVRL